MSYSVDIKGLKELQVNIDKLPEQLQKEASAIVENGAKQWVRLAKLDAPVNFGVLRNHITYAQVIADKLRATFIVISGSEYSAYLEWGTITKVFVPVDQQAYAIQFKGKGLRTNGGIFPHPYFFKQGPAVQKLIERGIGSILKEVKL